MQRSLLKNVLASAMVWDGVLFAKGNNIVYVPMYIHVLRPRNPFF
uniref:Uncharacterized protein n=1 Tax=Chenopodium quinoa TaxID=63459 RepID=A0A803MID3_CHEQI